MDRTKEFLSTISHEIRTPLTSIKGFSKTIIDSYDNLTDEQKKKFLQIIYEQSQRLINLVENALTAADSDKAYNNLVFKKTDINFILQKSIDVVKINYKDKKYITNFENNLYSMTDNDKLEQVFVNLLDNASKYSINSNDIEIKTYTKDKKNIISIKNYGSYIDKKEQNAVFEKFYRIDSYLTSKTQGSGLGLYIVKMLIDKMNGNIYINSSNDKIPFCEFIIELPVFAIEEFTKTKKGCSYV